MLKLINKLKPNKNKFTEAKSEVIKFKIEAWNLEYNNYIQMKEAYDAKAEKRDQIGKDLIKKKEESNAHRQKMNDEITNAHQTCREACEHHAESIKELQGLDMDDLNAIRDDVNPQ